MPRNKYYNMRKRSFLFVQLLFCIATVTYGKSIITINNQSDFGSIQQHIKECINNGETNIVVKFAPGVYLTHENHLVLNGIVAKDTRLQINGNGAILIPYGKEYHEGDEYDGVYSCDNSWMCGDADIGNWTQSSYADGLVEVVDESNKLCRLKSKGKLSDDLDISNAFILLTHWYQSSVYKVTKIEGGFIFFIVNDLAPSSLNNEGYYVNDDYYYRKQSPRYKLCNVETGEDYLRVINGKVKLPSTCDRVYEGKTKRFMLIQNCSFKEIEIRDFVVLGNGFSNYHSFFEIISLISDSFIIKKCTFNGMRGNVIMINKSNNIQIKDNSFKSCYYYGISSDNNSKNIKVTDNQFENMGLRMQNTFSILCQGANYEIKNNKIVNFGYGGILVGFWFRASNPMPCNGVVENNVLTYTADYKSRIKDFGMMDNGAIYLATRNDGAIIRFNRICGFSGVGGNRGVFCDNGAYGFQLYGNVILNIANGDYCIASRRDGRLEELKDENKDLGQSNTNNIIRDNIIDGKILFAGNECLNNGCEYGPNFFLVHEGCEPPKTNVLNVSMTREDIVLRYTGEKRGRIGIDVNSYKQLKKSNEWTQLRKRFVRKNK